MLMSAIQKNVESSEQAGQSNDLAKFRFEQGVRIPSYLIAIVVGDLVSKDIGPRSRVWTEKDMLDKAAYEFAQVFQYLTILQSEKHNY